MLIRLDSLAPEPIFEQIVHQVKGAVARGELRDGDRLPSVRELARTLAVNPNTVIKAYSTLHQEGVIVRRQGAGCFVSAKPSVLHDEERRRLFRNLAERAVTDAYHLGFEADEIREEIERALEKLDFPRKRRSP